MSYYKAHYGVLKRSSKYSIYLSHFNNLIFDVDFESKKESDDIMSFFLFADNIDEFNHAIDWIESNTGLEPYKTEWIEEKNK